MTDYTADTLPDWVAVGNKVVAIDHGGWNSRIDFEARVTKIGKRDITVAFINRPEATRTFRVKDLREQGRDYGSRLYAPTAPEVRRIKDEVRQRERVGAARTAVQDWINNRDHTPHAVTAIRALVTVLPSGKLKTALRAALDEHAPEADS